MTPRNGLPFRKWVKFIEYSPKNENTTLLEKGLNVLEGLPEILRERKEIFLQKSGEKQFCSPDIFKLKLVSCK